MRKKNKEGNIRKNGTTHIGIIVAICIAITIIVLANTVCVLIACCPELVKDLFNVEADSSMTGADMVESSIISTGVSILGIAVTVWTGLSIANSIDKKRLDDIDKRIDDADENIKKKIDFIRDIRTQQNIVDRDKLLHEMYLIEKDEATYKLSEKISELSVESHVPFLQLLKIEQNFRSVYEMHYSKSNQNNNLNNIANTGISSATDILKNTEDSTVKLYLNFRIAEFHFYMGYCCHGQERATHFIKAIETYKMYKDKFNADIPEYKPDETYPNILYLSCKGDPSISAYFCNSIGEAYSKIEQDKDQLKQEKGWTDEQLRTYGLQAVFYCTHANYWRSKSTYRRNLGCAIERLYGALLHYEKLKNEYKTALELDPMNSKNFKNLASLYDKHVNNSLTIESVKLPAKRIPPLCSKEFATTWKNLNETDQTDSLITLKNIHIVSKQAKAIHPSASIGYQYDCIYYRDMCAIYGNHTLETDSTKINEIKKEAKMYYDKAEENLMILKIIDPDNPMTKILRNDLDDLNTLL